MFISKRLGVLGSRQMQAVKSVLGLSKKLILLLLNRSVQDCVESRKALIGLLSSFISPS